MSLKELLQQEAKTIIDVRSEQEYGSGHIDDAVNIPVHEVRMKIDDIAQMQKPIIVYCLSGGRSMAAVSVLKSAGIEDVYNGGGIRDMQYALF